MDDGSTAIRNQLAEASTLAERLIGMSREAAMTLVSDQGFVPQPIPDSAAVFTTDLRADRVRFLFDETDRVVRAWAG